MDESVFNVSRAGRRIAAGAKAPPATGIAVRAQLVADLSGQVYPEAEDPWLRRRSRSSSSPSAY